MKQIVLRVDAVSGPDVQAGRVVNPGDVLGSDPETGKKILASCKGIVSGCKFDPIGHAFEICIETE